MTRMTAAERVYLGVLDDVQHQVIRPGDVLREDGLAERFDTSRTPVREALRRLIQDGLVEQHQSRLRVRRLTRAQVDEVYPVVAVLEGLASRFAAERLTAAELDELDALHTAMGEHARSGAHREYQAANAAFHAVLLHASHNAALVGQVGTLHIVTGQLRTYQLSIPGRMARSVEEHAALLDRLRDHDAAGAEAVMRAHVESAHQVLALALASEDLVDPTPITRTIHSSRTPGDDDVH